MFQYVATVMDGVDGATSETDMAAFFFEGAQAALREDLHHPTPIIEALNDAAHLAIDSAAATR